MRAVVYARVSSEGQRDRETIATQLRLGPDFIARQGWDLVRPPTTYVDDGRTASSGHLGKRAGLAALMRDAGAGVFDVVVLFDIDRLTRADDWTERGAILGAFQRAGVQLADAKTGQVLDLSTSSGDLFASLGAFFAADWLRKHRVRTIEGKRTATSRGRKAQGPTPYGYRYDLETGVWSIDPVTGPVVREIYERVAAGQSCYSIAADLTARRIPRSSRGGTEWSRDRVWLIASSRQATTYLGRWIAVRATGTAIAVPPIIDQDLADRAELALARHGRRGLRRTKHVYLLEGLATCAVCGSPMQVASSTSARSRGRRYHRLATYVCKRRLRVSTEPGSQRCVLPRLPVAMVDRVLWDTVRAWLDKPVLLDRALDRAQSRSSDNGAAWRDDAAEYRARLDRLGRTERAILARFRRGVISEGALDAELAALGRERDAVRAQLATAERAHAAAADTAGRARAAQAAIADPLGAIAAAEPADRQRIVRLLIAGVEVAAAGAHATLRVSEDSISNLGADPCRRTRPEIDRHLTLLWAA